MTAHQKALTNIVWVEIKSKTKDDDEVKEDPIQKAEREFFEIIKKVFLLSLPFTYICTLYPYIIVKIHFS